jgi:peptidoglycan-associated lipoprotein
MIRTVPLALSVLVAASLAACSSTPLETPKPAPVVDAAPTPPNSGAGTATTNVATVTLDPLDDPQSGLAARSVYFGYDVFTIDPKYQALLQAHGQLLASRPAAAIRVEGNTDERGSAEYNLALGDKRAQAVAKQLEVNGAKASQIEAVSYGSERPKAAGHDETAWAENRRADIRYVKR